jgi:hypothetical protein
MIKEANERFNVNIRLSKSEAEHLKVQADKELLSMSAYVRRAVFLKERKAVKQ